MIEFSKEQIDIINYAETYNIMCDSVAGSGKTTTILGILNKYKEDKCLILTYNARLKYETRQKLIEYKLLNGIAESYHSFCHNNINKYIINDETLNKYLKKNSLENIILNLDYDRIIIDEIQDMKPLYYELVCKIISSCKKQPLLFVIGDTFQSIYGYELADERYLINADKLFNFNKKEWKKMSLSISYRITNTMADLLNNQFNMNRNIISNKISQYKPRYLICNTFIENFNKFNKDLSVLYEIQYYLSLNYKFEDIFIIAPSVNPKSPISELVSILKENDIKVKICENEVNKDLIKDKIACLTYHKSKGLERKVCIVYGCDSYFFELHNNYIDTICPNELYVALTRSLERLTLIQHNTKNPLPFLNLNTLHNYVDIIDDDNFIDKIHNNNSYIRFIKSNNLTNYTSNIIINKCLENIKYNEIKLKIKNPLNILNDNDLKLYNYDDFDNDNIIIIKKDLPNLIKDSIIYYFYYKKYNYNPLINMIIKEKNKLSYYNQKLFNESDLKNFYNFCIDNNNLPFIDFIKLYHIYYSIINNNVYDLINNNYNYNYTIPINKVFNNINKIFDDNKINLLDRKLLLKNKNKCQPIIDLNIDKKIILQDIINKFDINSLLYDINNNDLINSKLIKIFKDDNKIKSNLIIHLEYNILLYHNDTLIFITYNRNNIDYELINCVICHYLIKFMYKIKNLNLQLFNPLNNKIYNINYDKEDYIINILLLNRYIGFKQLTNNYFLLSNLNIFNKYFKDE